MVVKNSKQLTILKRRRDVADLYLQGWNQTAIAEELGVAQPTISDDVKHIRAEWRVSAVRDFDEARQLELMKLDRIEREAWSAWDQSKKPAQSAVVTGEGVGQRTRKSMKNQHGDRPHLRIRHDVAKGGHGRTVPHWWDQGTLSDLAAWRAERVAHGGCALFVASRQTAAREKPLSLHTLRKRFLTACKTLGPERRRTLTIHHGRHTFISHALAGGRSLAEVREAAGHASLLATSAYLHVAVEDGGSPGRLFQFA